MHPFFPRARPSFSSVPRPHCQQQQHQTPRQPPTATHSTSPDAPSSSPSFPAGPGAPAPTGLRRGSSGDPRSRGADEHEQQQQRRRRQHAAELAQRRRAVELCRARRVRVLRRPVPGSRVAGSAAAFPLGRFCRGRWGCRGCDGVVLSLPVLVMQETAARISVCGHSLSSSPIC